MRATRDNMEEFLIQCGLATKREATPTAEPTPRSATDPADMPLEELVKHEDQFAERLRTLAGRVSTTKMEIGRMVAAYERVHIGRYGAGLMGHLAEMAGLSVSAVYNYHSAWRLLERCRNIPDLENLSPSHHVELARLIALPDVERIVSETVATITAGHLTVQGTAGLVREILDAKKRRPIPKKKEAAKPPPPRLVNPLTPQQEQVLEDAIAVLQQTSSVETRPNQILHMAEHRMRIVRLGTGLIDHVAALVDAEPSDAENCGVMIEQIRNRCDVLLARLNQGRAA